MAPTVNLVAPIEPKIARKQVKSKTHSATQVSTLESETVELTSTQPITKNKRGRPSNQQLYDREQLNLIALGHDPSEPNFVQLIKDNLAAAALLKSQIKSSKLKPNTVTGECETARKISSQQCTSQPVDLSHPPADVLGDIYFFSGIFNFSFFEII